MRRTSAVYVGNGRVLTRTANGFKLFVDAHDVGISPHLILEGVWEEWTEAALRTLVKPGMRVLEIGANVGYFTLVLARRVGPSGSVWSFECDARLAQMARDNVELNGFTSIARIDDRAVSDSEGALTFFTAERHRGGGTLIAGLAQIPELTDYERRETAVSSTTIDAIMNEARHSFDFVKIDAEGAEWAIVRGGGRLFENRDASLTVVMEFAPDFIQSQGNDPAEHLRAFERMGFTLHVIDERRRRVVRTEPASLLSRRHSEMVLKRTKYAP
jgi:FkbM family methyltransferase